MENYIKNTGVKICVTFNDPEKKKQSSQWKSLSSSNMNKGKSG
jgi:hypothetical protein